MLTPSEGYDTRKQGVLRPGQHLVLVQQAQQLLARPVLNLQHQKVHLLAPAQQALPPLRLWVALLARQVRLRYEWLRL